MCENALCVHLLRFTKFILHSIIDCLWITYTRKSCVTTGDSPVNIWTMKHLINVKLLVWLLKRVRTSNFIFQLSVAIFKNVNLHWYKFYYLLFKFNKNKLLQTEVTSITLFIFCRRIWFILNLNFEIIKKTTYN